MDRNLFFLKFGYFPQPTAPTINVRPFEFDVDATLCEMASKGEELFLKGIEQEFESNSFHVIPLSGGLDSRAILSGLLKFTEAKNIFAYSYGSKGTFDYEIGRLIAKDVGINHVSFDLQDYVYDLDDLMYQAESVGRQTVLFHTPPTRQIDRMFGGACLWSGIIGDVIAGSAIPANPSVDLSYAVERYLAKKVYSDHCDGVDYCEYKNAVTTFASHSDSTWTISFDEQVILSERYEKFYKPHILHIKNAVFKEPFVNNEFMDFMLSAPLDFRVNKVLYQGILKRLDRNLFSLPTKQNMGGGLFTGKYEMLFRRALNKLRTYDKSKINRSTNYFDFYRKLSTDKGFKLLVTDLVSSFSHRAILGKEDVTDAFSLFQMNGNREQLIRAMISLEVHLQNDDTDIKQCVTP